MTLPHSHLADEISGAFDGFYHGKTVLVTGHTGFKGSWLALWLTSLGARVVGYALDPPSTPSHFEAADLGSLIVDIRGDIRDRTTLVDALQTHRPDIVFHLAAQALVRQAYNEPVDTFGTNVMGTVNVLDAVLRTDSVSAAVIISSDKCYRNQEWPWGYRETDTLGGSDPYSASKGCAELAVTTFRDAVVQRKYRDRWLPIASARAGNVIGGGDWAEDRLVPDVLSAFLGGRAACIRRPLAVRPWQHVLEPLGGYLLLAQRLHAQGAPFATAWNFGPDAADAQPVQGVVEQLARLWGEGAGWQSQPGDHPHEASLLMLDVSRARHQLGWRPRLPLEAALQMVVDWARAHRDGADARTLTLRQIQAYQALCTRPNKDAE